VAQGDLRVSDQLLNAAIDHPAADAYDALLVKRLRRLRAARRLQRTARARLSSQRR
jgi:hypothetical protein